MIALKIVSSEVSCSSEFHQHPTLSHEQHGRYHAIAHGASPQSRGTPATPSYLALGL